MKCLTYVHVAKPCKGQVRCRYCGGPEHKIGEMCSAKLQVSKGHCVVCQGRRMPGDGKCLVFPKEKGRANLTWRNQHSRFPEPTSTLEIPPAFQGTLITRVNRTASGTVDDEQSKVGPKAIVTRANRSPHLRLHSPVNQNAQERYPRIWRHNNRLLVPAKGRTWR